MGCPALEMMRAQMERGDRASSAREPEVAVVLDDSWSTDRITPEGREKLRAAGFAPPAPRTRRDADARPARARPFRCPYCGSTRHAAREHLRPDPVPLDPLLQRLPPAVRAVQDDLMATTGLRAANQPPPLEGYNLFAENRRARRGAPARGRRRRGGALRGVRPPLRRRAARAGAARQREPAGAAHARPLRPPHRRGRVPPRLARAACGLGVEHGLHALPWREPGARRARRARRAAS